MKKIGVITWFWGPNYGTVLQAIALQVKLKDLGYIPELINITHEDSQKRTLIGRLKGGIFNKIHGIKKYAIKKKYGKSISYRDKKMNFEVNNKCKISSIVNNDSQYIKICNEYDYLIFGSDQIWNPNWYHPYYFADFNEIITPRIAYAPSLGVSLIHKENENKYRIALERFFSIAVREDCGVKEINRIIGKECTKVVDPTMLLNANDWDELFDVKSVEDRYILLYLLKDNKKHMKAVSKFAKSKRMKIKTIPYQFDTYFMHGEIMAETGPKEFLELIKNAEYVITDSFHGIVFSIIYQRQFYALTRFNDKENDSQNSRVYQIINEYGLQNRLQKFNTSQIQECGKIEFAGVYSKLKENIEISTKYLRNALKGIESDE